jgi:hypothetical protein
MSLRRRGYLEEAAADVTLKQLGGMKRLKVMIGAKDFVSDNGGKTLIFKFPNRGAKKPNYVKITLTGRDDYNVEFGRISSKKSKDFPSIRTPVYKKFKTYRGVYVDMLYDIFEKETGLYLTLSPRR